MKDNIVSKIIIPLILIILIIFLAVRENSPKELSLSFMPKQCVENLWDKYYRDGGVLFIKEPTQEELIRVYYSSKYNLDIGVIDKVNLDSTCQTCEICNKNYYFRISIDSKDSKIFLNEGWIKN